MQTSHDIVRDHILDSLGLTATGSHYVPNHLPYAERMPDLDELRETEWPEEAREFVARQQHRFVMAAFRYTRIADPRKRQYNFRKGMKKKLAAYEESGNTEHLVDLANYALLESMWPSHPRAHFWAEDDHSHCPR